MALAFSLSCVNLNLPIFFLFFIFLSGTRGFPRTEAKLNVQSHTTQPGASFDCICGGSVYRIEIPSCRTLSDTRGAPAKSNLSGTLGFPIVQTTNWSVSWEMIPYSSPKLSDLLWAFPRVNCLKTIPFTVAHTIAHVWQHPPPGGLWSEKKMQMLIFLR